MTHQFEISSLDDVRALLENLPEADSRALAQTQAREPNLTKPAGSLGRLETLSHWAAAWQHRYPPRAGNFVCHLYAGNHGIASRGVSAFPVEATELVVQCFRKGQATINQLCRAFDIAIEVHPLQLDRPVADFTLEAAMTEQECVAAINYGISSISADSDLVLLGEMGIGNTSSASAIAFALFGGTASQWVGRGSGIDDEMLVRKTAVIREAVERRKAVLSDPLEILRHFGGRELAAITGAVIGARLRHVPVMLDGLICTAAAAPLEVCRKGALDHCQVAHKSKEPGHSRMMERIGKVGLLDLDMRLGEASGAALAAALVRAAIECHNGIATFEEAGIVLPAA